MVQSVEPTMETDAASTLSTEADLKLESRSTEEGLGIGSMYSACDLPECDPIASSESEHQLVNVNFEGSEALPKSRPVKRPVFYDAKDPIAALENSFLVKVNSLEPNISKDVVFVENKGIQTQDLPILNQSSQDIRHELSEDSILIQKPPDTIPNTKLNGTGTFAGFLDKGGFFKRAFDGLRAKTTLQSVKPSDLQKETLISVCNFGHKHDNNNNNKQDQTVKQMSWIEQRRGANHEVNENEKKRETHKEKKPETRKEKKHETRCERENHIHNTQTKCNVDKPEHRKETKPEHPHQPPSCTLCHRIPIFGCELNKISNDINALRYELKMLRTLCKMNDELTRTGECHKRSEEHSEENKSPNFVITCNGSSSTNVIDNSSCKIYKLPKDAKSRENMLRELFPREGKIGFLRTCEPRHSHCRTLHRSEAFGKRSNNCCSRTIPESNSRLCCNGSFFSQHTIGHDSCKSSPSPQGSRDTKNGLDKCGTSDEPINCQMLHNISSICQCCAFKKPPVFDDLLIGLNGIIRDRAYKDIMLSIQQRDHIYHVKVEEKKMKRPLGCLLVSRRGITRANRQGVFKQITTFSVIDVGNKMKAHCESSEPQAPSKKVGHNTHSCNHSEKDRNMNHFISTVLGARLECHKDINNQPHQE